MNHTGTYKLRLAAIAAAVGLALGGAAVAQQGGGAQNGAQQSSQSDQSQRSQSNDRSQARDQSSQSQSDSRSQNNSQANQSDQGKQGFDKLARQDSDLSTFVRAVEAAGMEDSLTDGTNYTVFAPSDSAFKAMSGKSTDELMKPENRDELIGLLRAHIVADDVTPDKVKQLGAAETIDGGTVNLDSKDGSVMIGDAKVTDDQGIQVTDSLRVYPIDQVLAANPSQEQARQGPQGPGRPPSPDR